MNLILFQVADDMLHQKVDVESCYIAAQTMRTKIQCSFHELPKESHHSLKVFNILFKRLFNQLKTVDISPKTFFNNLGIDISVCPYSDRCKISVSQQVDLSYFHFP